MKESIMEAQIVEDLALKKMLQTSDFLSEVTIPRAKVKRFPSNVSNLKMSASARSPSSNDSAINEVSNKQPLQLTNNRFKTKPIDIATLLDNPTPKVPMTRGIGRPYSNKIEISPPPPAPPPPVPKQELRPTKVIMAKPKNEGPSSSFLYSGNFDPNNPNKRIVTKPVPLKKEMSLNLKNAAPRPIRNNKNANRNKNVGYRNPLAVTQTSESIVEEDGVDMEKNNKFDNWADDLYNNNVSKASSSSGGAAKPVKRGNKKINQKPLRNKSRSSTSPQQNWVSAGGPSIAERSFHNPLAKNDLRERETRGDDTPDIALVALDNMIWFENGDELHSGGKMGEQLGDMAVDVAEVVASDDINTDEETEVERQQLPNSSKGGSSKCTIV